MEWIKLPDLPGTVNTSSLGVSAPFSGMIGKKLIVAGGCNFPDKPVTEGGVKRYYDEIFLLDMNNPQPEGWKLVGKLPHPVAYGACVTVPDGIVCIGGNNNEEMYSEVNLLSFDSIKEVLSIHPLPSLPNPMDNFSAATDGRYVYAAGGNVSGKPENIFLRLDLDQKQKGWESLVSFPGAARVQPVMVAQNTSDGIKIFLAGGFQPVLGNKASVVPTEVLSYDPVLNEWSYESDLPRFEDGANRTLTGGGGVAIADNGLLFAGGVNYDRFLAAIDRPRQIGEAKKSGNNTLIDSLQTEAQQYMHHAVEWYKFNRTLLHYNTLTKEWKELGNYEQLARAGAGMVLYDNRLIIINGELKPGIRTPQVNMLGRITISD